MSSILFKIPLCLLARVRSVEALVKVHSLDWRKAKPVIRRLLDMILRKILSLRRISNSYLSLRDSSPSRDRTRNSFRQLIALTRWL